TSAYARRPSPPCWSGPPSAACWCCTSLSPPASRWPPHWSRPSRSPFSGSPPAPTAAPGARRPAGPSPTASSRTAPSPTARSPAARLVPVEVGGERVALGRCGDDVAQLPLAVAIGLAAGEHRVERQAHRDP